MYFGCVIGMVVQQTRGIDSHNIIKSCSMPFRIGFIVKQSWQHGKILFFVSTSKLDLSKNFTFRLFHLRAMDREVLRMVGGEIIELGRQSKQMSFRGHHRSRNLFKEFNHMMMKVTSKWNCPFLQVKCPQKFRNFRDSKLLKSVKIMKQSSASNCFQKFKIQWKYLLLLVLSWLQKKRKTVSCNLFLSISENEQVISQIV